MPHTKTTMNTCHDKELQDQGITKATGWSTTVYEYYGGRSYKHWQLINPSTYNQDFGQQPKKGNFLQVTYVDKLPIPDFVYQLFPVSYSTSFTPSPKDVLPRATMFFSHIAFSWLFQACVSCINKRNVHHSLSRLFMGNQNTRCDSGSSVYGMLKKSTNARFLGDNYKLFCCHVKEARFSMTASMLYCYKE